MAKKSVYTVFEGKKTGVFNSWPDCHEQVDGFKGASYQIFNMVDEAYEAIRAVQREKLSNHSSSQANLKPYKMKKDSKNLQKLTLNKLKGQGSYLSKRRSSLCHQDVSRQGRH